MNSRERYLNTFKGIKTDRVPVSLFIVEQGHFMTQVCPDTDPWDHVRQFADVIAFEKEMGADVFVRLLAELYAPALHVIYGGVDISQQTENWEVATTQYQNGNSKVLRSTIRTPGGNLEQEFTINEIRPGTFMYACTKLPVKCEEDLDLVIKYEPHMPAAYPEIVKKVISRTKEMVGDDGVVGVWTPYGPFNNASHLVSLEDLYALYLTEPEFYEKLIRFSTDRFKDYCQAILDAKPDVAHVGGNVPGGFLGKRIYDTYILPHEKEYIAFCQKEGIHAMYHNCGQIMNLVESYIHLGVDIVEPFSPPPLGDTDLGKALDIVQGTYAVVAGIDQVNLIQGSTAAKVAEATKRAVLTGKEKGCGKFIIQNADFMEYNTPVENIRTFVQTALEYGRY